MNSWFHYAKVYAATAGCIGFMMLKYSWGKIGRSHWFKAFPLRHRGHQHPHRRGERLRERLPRLRQPRGFPPRASRSTAAGTTCFNGIAGLLNIACMTGWFGIYISKKRQDMLWPDMTWVFIIAYDLWNFCYTYNCLPTHSWYCGIALLLAPTIAGLIWNKGGWIQKPRLHAFYLVHVLPDGADVRERLRLRRAVGEQPGREPGRVHRRAGGQPSPRWPTSSTAPRSSA